MAITKRREGKIHCCKDQSKHKYVSLKSHDSIGMRHFLCISTFIFSTSPPSWLVPSPYPPPSWDSSHMSGRKERQSILTYSKCTPLTPWTGCSSQCRSTPASCRRRGCINHDILTTSKMIVALFFRLFHNLLRNFHFWWYFWILVDHFSCYFSRTA